MILHDPYAMHRRWWDMDWRPGPNDTDWVIEDYILADVYQIIEDFTDKSNGVFIPYDQSGDIHWDVHSSFSGYDEAIEKAQKSRKELKPGERLYAVPVFDDEDNKPTLESWAKDQEENITDRRPSSARNGRPPTAEELAAMGLA